MNVNYIIRCSTLIRYFLNSLPPLLPMRSSIKCINLNCVSFFVYHSTHNHLPQPFAYKNYVGASS